MSLENNNPFEFPLMSFSVNGLVKGTPVVAVANGVTNATKMGKNKVISRNIGCGEKIYGEFEFLREDKNIVCLWVTDGKLNNDYWYLPLNDFFWGICITIPLHIPYLLTKPKKKGT